MSGFKSRDEHNAPWQAKIDKIYEDIDNLQEKHEAEENSIEKEIKRLEDKYETFLESKSYKITAKSEKAILRQTQKFEDERLQRKHNLDKAVGLLKENINEITKKMFDKVSVLKEKAEKYKKNLYTYDKPIECEFCPGVFYNSENEKIKHQESLLYLLASGKKDPIPNGLKCSICKETFTQYHAEPNMNPEYVKHIEECRIKNKPATGNKLEDLFRKLEEKINPVEIDITNQRAIFNWLGILNSRNRLEKLKDRLEEAWEFTFQCKKSDIDKDDSILTLVLSGDRKNIYCKDKYDGEHWLCTIEEAGYDDPNYEKETEELKKKQEQKEESPAEKLNGEKQFWERTALKLSEIQKEKRQPDDGFGVGKLLLMPHRRLPYDLRDRNPIIDTGFLSLRYRPLIKEELKHFKIGKPVNDKTNFYNIENETSEARTVLKEVLLENPDGKKKRTTTTTVVG